MSVCQTSLCEYLQNGRDFLHCCRLYSASVCHQKSHLLHWFRLKSGSVCRQIRYNSQWLNMHLLSCLLQLTVALSLYKDMPSWNASSHFTHTLSLHSRTHLFNMSRYLLPAWNERPFYHCQRWAKMTIFLVPIMYGRRCWVCLDTDLSGYVGFYISIHTLMVLIWILLLT
jgi:hypothetical protein